MRVQVLDDRSSTVSAFVFCAALLGWVAGVVYLAVTGEGSTGSGGGEGNADDEEAEDGAGGDGGTDDAAVVDGVVDGEATANPAARSVSGED